MSDHKEEVLGLKRKRGVRHREEWHATGRGSGPEVAVTHTLACLARLFLPLSGVLAAMVGALKCPDSLSFDARQKIFESFWGMKGHSCQSTFISQSPEAKNVARRYVKDPSHRKRTYVYALTLVSEDGDTTVQVCQKTFCEILGISHSRVDFFDGEEVADWRHGIE